MSGRSIRWTGTCRLKEMQSALSYRALYKSRRAFAVFRAQCMQAPNLMHPERQVSRALRCTSELHLWLVTAQLLSLARCNPIVLFNFVFLISKKKKKKKCPASILQHVAFEWTLTSCCWSDPAATCVRVMSCMPLDQIRWLGQKCEYSDWCYMLLLSNSAVRDSEFGVHVHVLSFSW